MASALNTPLYWHQATTELARVDPVLHTLITRFPDSILRSRGAPFITLMRAIVGQQISVKAADSIWLRVQQCCGRITPQNVLQQASALRACGLTEKKVDYAIGVARYFQAQRKSRMSAWQSLSDEAVITELTALHGIGRWSAEMFLMFTLLRPNILPLGDIGLLNAIGKHYCNGQRPSPSQAQQIAQPWQPWCSVATWYLWRSIDPAEVAY